LQAWISAADHFGRSRPWYSRSIAPPGRASRPNVATPVASTGRPTAMSLTVTASLYLQHLL